jgi:hypothetical protein
MTDARGSFVVSTFLVLLINGLFMLCPQHVTGQDETTQTIKSIVLDLRALYVESYPDIEDLVMFRKLNESEQATRKKEALEKQLETTLSEIRDRVKNLSPSSNHIQKRAIRLQTLVDVYIRWQRKVLEDWTAKNPNVYEAFNERELMRKGLAKPDTLRRLVVRMLIEFMNDDMIFSRNPVFVNVQRLRNQVTALNWSVIRTYLRLISRIEQVQGDQEKLEEVREEVRAEWKTFWNDIANRIDRIRNDLNRELLLFRGRELTSSVAEQLQERAMNAKRQFQFILAYREVKGPFTSQASVRGMLVHLSKRVMLRLWNRLRTMRRGMVSYYNTFQNLDERYLQVSDKTTYDQKSKRLKEVVNNERKQLQLNEQRKEVEKIPLDQVEALSKRMIRMFGERETRLGKTIQSVTRLTSDAFSLADKLVAYPDFLIKTYTNTPFDDAETFQQNVSTALDERKSTIQAQMNELRSIFSSVKEEVQSVKNNVHVSLEDLTTGEPADRERNEETDSSGP